MPPGAVCLKPAMRAGSVLASLLGRGYFNLAMSKAEILDELPKLTPAERQEIAIRIQEIGGDELTEAEKQILDRELVDFEWNPDPGLSWAEVEARIRGSVSR